MSYAEENVLTGTIEKKTITEEGYRAEWSIDVLWEITHAEMEQLEESIRSHIIFEDFRKISEGTLASAIKHVFGDDKTENIIPCHLFVYNSPINEDTYQAEMYHVSGKIWVQNGMMQKALQGQANYYDEKGVFESCAWFEKGKKIAHERSPEELMRNTNVIAANLLRDVDFPPWEGDDPEYGPSL